MKPLILMLTVLLLTGFSQCTRNRQGMLYEIEPIEMSAIINFLRTSKCQNTRIHNADVNRIESIYSKAFGMKVKLIDVYSIFDKDNTKYSMKYTFITSTTNSSTINLIFASERKGKYGTDEQYYINDIRDNISTTLKNCLGLAGLESEKFIEVDFE